MAPIFPKWSNKVPYYLLISVSILAISTVGFIWYYFSPKYTAVGYNPVQPIAFSHALHAGEMGMDCRYCHSTVTKTAFAALPTVQTCMGCHNKVKANSPRIALLKSSFETKKPIPWVQVHFLPRHAHFNHSAHVLSGVGCASCHGRVDTMESVYQTQPLSMGWCLECHQNYKDHIVPFNQVTNMAFGLNENKNTTNVFSHEQSTSKPQSQLQPPTACGSCHY